MSMRSRNQKHDDFSVFGKEIPRNTNPKRNIIILRSFWVTLFIKLSIKIDMQTTLEQKYDGFSVFGKMRPKRYQSKTKQNNTTEFLCYSISKKCQEKWISKPILGPQNAISSFSGFCVGSYRPAQKEHPREASPAWAHGQTQTSAMHCESRVFSL